MNRNLLAILAVVAIVVVLAVVFVGNNFFSSNVPNGLTPAPTATPTATPAASSYALTISYSETHRETMDNGVTDLWVTLNVQNHENNARNLLLDEFYLTVDGVEVPIISQTTGNIIIDPNGSWETTVTIRVAEIGYNYKPDYRDHSLSIKWVDANPDPTPTHFYAVTLKYKATERRILTSDDIKDPRFVGYTLLSIGLNVQVNDGNTHSFTYENFYLIVNGVEVTAADQLKGSWTFNQPADSQVWFMFDAIGANYELNYRGASFTIEWIKQ